MAFSYPEFDVVRRQYRFAGHWSGYTLQVRHFAGLPVFTGLSVAIRRTGVAVKIFQRQGCTQSI